MAGCFGNSAEDRAKERELIRYLDSQYSTDRFNVAVDDRLDELWEQIASPHSASQLDADWEILSNEEGNILAMCSYVKRSGDKEALADMLIGLVNKKLRYIAKREVSEKESA